MGGTCNLAEHDAYSLIQPKGETETPWNTPAAASRLPQVGSHNWANKWMCRQQMCSSRNKTGEK